MGTSPAFLTSTVALAPGKDQGFPQTVSGSMLHARCSSLGVEDDLDTIESHGILRLAAKDVAQGPKHVRGGCIRGDEDIFIFLVLLGLLLFLVLSACWLTTRLLGSFLLLLLLDSKGPAESEISSLFGVTCSAGPGIVRSFFLDAKNLDTSKSQLLRPDRLPSTARIKRFDDVCEVLREVLQWGRPSEIPSMYDPQPSFSTGWHPNGSA